MKKLWEKLETLMSAAAFAEEGEAETARQIAAEADEPEAKERESRDEDRPAYRVAPLAKGSRV